MRKIKRGGGSLIRSKENKMTCNNGGQTMDSLIAGDVHGDSNQDFWVQLSQEVASNSSKSVVSIAVSDGNTVLFACSGIAIEHQGYVTRFLTSAKVARALNDETKDHDNLKVEVCHEGNVVVGFLGKCAFDLGIAVVNVMTFLDVQVILLNHLREFMPYSNVVAVGRGISGKLMSTNGVLTPDTSRSEDKENLMLSTCKISEAWEGGPLFDVQGNFVGMNLFFGKGRTLFLPASIIFGQLLLFQMSLITSKFLAQLENMKADSDGKELTKRGSADLSRTSKKDKRTDDLTRSKTNITDLARSSNNARSSNKKRRTDDLTSRKKEKKTCTGGGKKKSLISDDLNEDPFWNLDSKGNPERDMPDEVLVNSFEDTFGDIYGGGVWSELSETVSSNISQNVVSLASFYGEKRIFACTGFFIEWNGSAIILTSASLVSNFVDDKKIAENMRIEVLLPNKERRAGALQHYSLHYNVALVNVKDFFAPHPANIPQMKRNHSHTFVAIGCVFESGILMAASGQHTEILGRLNCKLLQYSTCKITKAGIGGPLVDSDGKFIGMNFIGMDPYCMSFDDEKGPLTPFLPSDVILDVLAYLKTKPTVSEVGLDVYASSVLDWAIDGDDSSFHPNRWPVPKAKYYPPQCISGGFRRTKHTKCGKLSERIRPRKLLIVNGIKCWAL